MPAISGVSLGLVTETIHEQAGRVLVEMSKYCDRPFVVRIHVKARHLRSSCQYRQYHKSLHNEKHNVA